MLSEHVVPTAEFSLHQEEVVVFLQRGFFFRPPYSYPLHDETFY